MPAEVQERAEAVDRALFLAIYSVLLILVLSLMHATSITLDAVGLTTNNWKSAIAFGVLSSLAPMGLTAMLLRRIPGAALREAPESRGPLSAWVGLTALGIFSNELWRAFCITSLIRLDFATWLAVLITTIAFAVPRLSTSSGKALGAAMFGGFAGFLFVETGSLLALLTMSLIVRGAHLYQCRHVR
jgi:hypothetical protein